MAKLRRAPSADVRIAGFTPAEWKQHMDTDEDWTERLEGAPEASVLEVIAALDHADADVRALACSLAYAIGVSGLGAHADRTVARLSAIAEGDPKPKVRSRARVVHEGLAGELQRATIRRELPWLTEWSEAAVPQAVAALDDARDYVRLQVYMWWANAASIPASVRPAVADKLAQLATRETDEVTRRAAELAHAHVRGA